ncbi:MAG: NAD(P)-dependent glycerol-3-phosphate dehydrogenase [Akkermansiaceae bacterium]|jgi:glycerol-3-phosphate dehydrogenase (NAD(P)+)|nr:NAD(P)-dependent glycerol-3-phosphate dehydrogenase [Akkermansiaceae bacterium]
MSTFPDKPNVLVLGSGSWGTALGALLTNNAGKVSVYGKDDKSLDAINTSHTNPHYLPGVTLPPELRATKDINEATDADLILFVVPSAATAIVAEQLAALPLKDDVVLLSCAKGIEKDTGRRMSEIIAAHHPDLRVAVFSGPTHAEEVSRNLATCAVVGSTDDELATALQNLFTTPHFRSYRSDDVAGIELGGALKNVFAIAAGCAKGLGLGDNAISALVTRGLAEMTRLGSQLGGRPETFMGLSGIGDLVTTCYSEHSRNHRVGLALGRGKTLREAQDALGMVAEGVPNTLSIHQAAHKIGVRSPLIDAVYAILYEDKPASEVLDDLLTREPRSEND